MNALDEVLDPENMIGIERGDGKLFAFLLSDLLYETIGQARAELARLRRIEEAAKVLVLVLEEAQDDMMGIFQSAAIHGVVYKGKTWTVEKLKMDAALKEGAE